jgi:hypothetical protein
MSLGIDNESESALGNDSTKLNLCPEKSPRVVQIMNALLERLDLPDSSPKLGRKAAKHVILLLSYRINLIYELVPLAFKSDEDHCYAETLDKDMSSPATLAAAYAVVKKVREQDMIFDKLVEKLVRNERAFLRYSFQLCHKRLRMYFIQGVQEGALYAKICNLQIQVRRCHDSLGFRKSKEEEPPMLPEDRFKVLPMISQEDVFQMLPHIQKLSRAIHKSTQGAYCQQELAGRAEEIIAMTPAALEEVYCIAPEACEWAHGLCSDAIMEELERQCADTTEWPEYLETMEEGVGEQDSFLPVAVECILDRVMESESESESSESNAGSQESGGNQECGELADSAV